MPKVSVLMSVYNGGKYIQQSLESIINQQFKDLEFIVVDDASDDDTASILNQVSDSRLIVIRNDKNMGLTWSLNRGLKIARGEFIARMDSDDISLPQRLQLQTDFLQAHPEAGLVCSAAIIIDQNGNPIGKHAPIFSPEHFYFFLHYKNCIVHSSVLFRKELALKLNGYNESYIYAQDYDLWQRFSKISKIFQINQFLVCWRNSKRNLSTQKKDLQDKVVFHLVRKNLANLTGFFLADKEIQAIQAESIPNENKLHSVTNLLDRLRKGILTKEKVNLKFLKLKKNKINRIVNQRIAHLLFAYFRRLKVLEYPGFFFRLGAKKKWWLIKKTISVIFRRIANYSLPKVK